MSSVRKRPRDQRDEFLHNKKDRRLNQYQRHNANTSPIAYSPSPLTIINSTTTSHPKYPTSPSVDNRDVFDMLVSLSQEQTMSQVFSMLTQIRQIADSLLSLFTKKPKSQSIASQTLPLIKSGLVAFAVFRQLHRNLQSEVEHCKEKTIEYSMNDLNNINLEIDGLTYEKLHYLREIQCCQSYQPIDKDCEFLKVPIKKLSTDDDSLPSETDDTEVPDTEKAHQLTIKLLESELEQRRALLIELDKILPPRKSLWLQKIKTRNNECDKLFKKLEQLRGQVSQLQTDCNISLVKQVQTHRLSRYLPLPLYSIYIQLTSWVQLQDEKALTVNILGDKTNAQQINGSWESKGLKALRELSIADLHKSHSLSLLLRLVWPTSGNPINVRIEYLVHLHIVTAIVEMAEDPYLLALLYPDDSGEFSPNFSNCYIHDEKKPFQILKSKGRAFRWLQFIAGLYFVHPLPAVTPIEISPDLKKSTDTSSGVMALDFQGTSDYSLTQIMSRLFKRLKVRETLNSHISLFKSGKIPIESNIKPNVPNTSWLHRWEDQSYLQAKELIKTIEAKMKLNEHSDFEESPPISVPVGTTVCVVTPPEFVAVHPNSIELSSRFFKIIFATSDTKEKICGLVQVFADYPSRIPVFLFYLETTNEISKSSIQEILKIQSAINTLESEDEALEESQILAYQVSKLQICLDIKCDLDKQKEKSIFANIEERYTKQFWKSLC